MVGNRASAHMELINDQCIHLPGLDRCRQFGEVHIDQLFKQLHRIQNAGLSLQFSQLLENLVDIPDRKRIATDDDASQTVFLKERHRIRNAEKRNPMAPLLKVQSQAAGGIHVPLCMDREKSDMRHGSYHGRCRALDERQQMLGAPFKPSLGLEWETGLQAAQKLMFCIRYGFHGTPGQVSRAVPNATHEGYL